MYQVLAKILAAILRREIHYVIAYAQPTFIHQRQIPDGVLANKLMEEAKRIELGSLMSE